MTRLRLATFNTLSGRALPDLDPRPDLLAEAVAGLAADVVALQEVDRHQVRSGDTDQARLIAEAMRAAGSDGALTQGPAGSDGAVAGYRFVATVHGTPGLRGWAPAIGRGALPDRPAGEPSETGGAAYGIALISRAPVRRWAAFGLGGRLGRYPVIAPGPRPRVIWLRDEPRAAVAAVLAEPRITVACAHLSFVPGRNVVQLLRLVRWLRTLPGPRVLLGDLNLPGGLPARLTGWRPLVGAATFPSPTPRLQLDHLLADGLPTGATVSDEHVLRLPVSDHRAALATLNLP